MRRPNSINNFKVKMNNFFSNRYLRHKVIKIIFFSIPYEPRSIAWCKDSVCVAFMGGYSLIKLNKAALSSESGICELFSAGIKNEKQFSSVTLLTDERFALIEDKTTKLVDLVRIKSKKSILVLLKRILLFRFRRITVKTTAKVN